MSDNQQQAGVLDQPAHDHPKPRVGMPDNGAERVQVSTAPTKREATELAEHMDAEEAGRIQPGERPRYSHTVAKAEHDDDGHAVHGGGLAAAVDDDDTWGVFRVLENANTGGPNIGHPEDGIWPAENDPTALDD